MKTPTLQRLTESDFWAGGILYQSIRSMKKTPYQAFVPPRSVTWLPIDFNHGAGARIPGWKPSVCR